MPGRHTPWALALMVLVWGCGAALVLGRGSSESDPKPIEREVRPGDEIWEGGVDRGSVGCLMGRMNGGSGKCMSEENCVLPIGKDQRGNCLMHNLERHGLGRYSKSWAKATYACACCNTTLFSSEDKFNDGHGFATFTRPISMGVVGYRDHQGSWLQHPHDTSIHCEKCGAHLGNVRATGPPPLHRRYHVNSDCVEQRCEFAGCAASKRERQQAEKVSRQWSIVKMGDDIPFEMRLRRMIVVWGIIAACACSGFSCWFACFRGKGRKRRRGPGYEEVSGMESGAGMGMGRRNRGIGRVGISSAN